MKVGGTKYFLIVILCAFVIMGAAIGEPASSPGVRKRCAFDIGSGETKLSAAEVAYTEQNPGVTKLLAKKVQLPFAASLKDSVIPQWLIEEAIAKMSALKRECEALGIREYSGVATSGFRMAANAHQALARIFHETNIPLQVITGEQEAALAFLAAASALQSNGENLVVWDIGGGSLQLSMSAEGSNQTHREYVISAGHQGAELFRREIAKRLKRGAKQSVNPLSQAEMNQAIELAKEWSRDVNPNIIEQLRRGKMRVVGLGGIHAESLAAQAGVRLSAPYRNYTLDGVRSAARRAVNMSDKDFRTAYPANKYPESQATNVALVLGYMEGLRITQVIPLEVTLADGLLVDAAYWPPAKLQ